MASLFLPIDKIKFDSSSNSNIKFENLLDILFKIYYYTYTQDDKLNDNIFIEYNNLIKDKYSKCLYGKNCRYNKFKKCKYLHVEDYNLIDGNDFYKFYIKLCKQKQFLYYANNNFDIEIFKIKEYFLKYNETKFEYKVDMTNKWHCIEEYLDYINYKYCSNNLFHKNGVIIIIKFKKKHQEYNKYIDNCIIEFYNNIICPIYNNINFNLKNNIFLNYFLEYKNLDIEKEKKFNEYIIKFQKYEIAYKNKILYLSNWLKCYEYYIFRNISEVEWKSKFNFQKPIILNKKNISIKMIKQLLAKGIIPQLKWDQIPVKFQNMKDEIYFQKPLVDEDKFFQKCNDFDCTKNIINLCIED